MLHHVVPLLAASAAVPRAEQRAGESFARRRARHRRPIPIVIAAAAAVLLLAACEEGPGSKAKGAYASKTFTVDQADFTIEADPRAGITASVAIVEYSVPAITSTAVQEGMVAAYLTGTTGAANWLQVPITFALMLQQGSVTTPVSVTISYRFRSGTAGLVITGNFNEAEMSSVVPQFHGWKFRVVVGS